MMRFISLLLLGCMCLCGVSSPVVPYVVGARVWEGWDGVKYVFVVSPRLYVLMAGLDICILC